MSPSLPTDQQGLVRHLIWVKRKNALLFGVGDGFNFFKKAGGGAGKDEWKYFPAKYCNVHSARERLWNIILPFAVDFSCVRYVYVAPLWLWFHVWGAEDSMYVAWVGLFRLQPDFRIQFLSKSSKKKKKMVSRCILSVIFHLSGFKLWPSPPPMMVCVKVVALYSWFNVCVVVRVSGEVL